MRRVEGNCKKLDFNEIVQEIGTSEAMAKNAVKILPGIAEQLEDIKRISNKAYPVGNIIITEDEISTDERRPTKERATFRQVTLSDIAKDPNINKASSVSVDLSDAIKIRQKRLVEHQEIVRLLAELNESKGFQLFEGKFDCLSVNDDIALLYEVKTILEEDIDQERQTVKGVGQLKYYKFSIVEQQMGISNVIEILVFSMKPNMEMIDFCMAEGIAVIWRDGHSFQISNASTGKDDNFDLDSLIASQTP